MSRRKQRQARVRVRIADVRARRRRCSWGRALRLVALWGAGVRRALAAGQSLEAAEAMEEMASPAPFRSIREIRLGSLYP